MEYREFGGTYYARMDRGDEIIESIMAICEKEGIGSAVFTGIGGCGTAEVQTFIPEKNGFETEKLEGVLELISITGDVTLGEEGLYHHTHAIFSFKDEEGHKTAGGHMKSATVLYTAEIEIRPVKGGCIGRKYDPETGTGFWDFRE